VERIPDSQTIHPPELFRLFIALTLPDQVKDAIEKTQVELRRSAPAEGIRWTKREQFHLTLKFLGNVGVERLESLKNSLRSACAPFAPFQLRAEGIGFFPNARRLRIIWAGVKDSHGELTQLQNAVEAVSSEFNRGEPKRNFTGHVTLARVKIIKRLEAEALVKKISGVANRFFGEWTADHIELIRSEPLPDGSRYTMLAAFPFSSAG